MYVLMTSYSNTELGKVLPENSTLLSLSVAWNTFSNQGVDKFVGSVGATQLRPMACLNDLDFSGNNLTKGVGSR